MADNDKQTGVYPLQRDSRPGELPGFQDLVFVSRPLCLPTHPREVHTAVRLGGTQGAHALELAMPFFLAGVSWSRLCKPARLAMAKASALAGIAGHTFELNPEERHPANLLVLQVFPEDLPTISSNPGHIDALELVFHQRAGKIFQTAQKLKKGIKSSPHPREDTTEKDNLIGKIPALWKLVDRRVPLIFALGMGRVPEDIRFAVQSQADIVRMMGVESDADHLPGRLKYNIGLPTLCGLAAARRTLAENGWENSLDLVVGGGIWDGADVAKALAMGATAVDVSGGALMALGCSGVVSGCGDHCPWEISPSKPNYMKKFDIEAGEQRVFSYLSSLQEEVQQICAVLGRGDITELSSKDLQALTIETSAITGLPLAGTGRVF